MAKPTRTSNSGSAVGTRVPGGPSGNVETTWMTKSPESTTIKTACTAWRIVRPMFQMRRLARRSGVTPGGDDGVVVACLGLARVVAAVGDLGGHVEEPSPSWPISNGSRQNQSLAPVPS